MRYLVLLILSLTAVTVPTVAQTRKINSLKTERTQLQKKIKNSEKQLQATQRDVRNNLNTLAKLNTDIDKQSKHVNTIQSEIGILDGKITTLEANRKALQQELEECKLRYKQSVMYMYRNRSAKDKLLFVFSADNFRQMYRRMRYMAEFAKYQRAQGEIIQQKETELAAVQAQLQGTKADKDKLLVQGQVEMRKLETQQAERKTVVAKLEKQQKALQNMLAADRKKYNQLNATIDRLIQIEIAAAEKRRKEAEARAKAAREAKAREEAAAAAKARNAKAATAAKGGSTAKTAKTKEAPAAPARSAKVYIAENTDYQLSSSFAANKGRLPVPITGAYRITSQFGQNAVEGLSGVTLDNKGINLTGQSGAAARAVFDGEVSAVFSLGGMINVLVRHGNYISVYCNLSSASVRQGQKVKARQTLGSVAADGNGGHTLHFQLRKETSKLNPAAWIAR